MQIIQSPIILVLGVLLSNNSDSKDFVLLGYYCGSMGDHIANFE